MLIIKAALECKMIILEKFDVEQHVVGEKKHRSHFNWFSCNLIVFEILKPCFSSSDKKISIQNNKISSSTTTTTKTIANHYQQQQQEIQQQH